MLKIERKDQKIQILFQNHERLWNRPFLLAFSFALFIHASALLLFRITPIMTGSKETILAPVAVNTEIPISSNVITNLQSSSIHYPFQPKRPELSVSLPRNIVDYQEPIYPFHSSSFPDLGYPEKSRPLTIIVSGPLAEAELLQENSFSPKEPLFEKYTVRVDNSSGRIFWHQSENPSNPSAEALLKTLRFTPTNKTPFTTGCIEIVYD